ncbi:DUF1932 domain-containing protein [Candidatus Poriferisodalis sp.]|uniref:NAD(P)-dependent oxidoreductase n=1 Tax=Candidatus Poriferisodalis sp. TaxID=3101277 RepID=UPI003B01FC66
MSEASATTTPDEAVTGVLHPGDMGVTLAAACSGKVLWASEGRSAETRERAHGAGLTDVGDSASLVAAADIVISVCPPHGAEELAATVADAGFAGCYVDANAVSPATARRIAARFEHFVDGSVIGPPAREPGTTRLYLAGPDAAGVAARFAGSPLDARVLDGGGIGAASALKMAYASWTKGTNALLVAVAALAAAEGVSDELTAEWGLSQSGLSQRLTYTSIRSAPKAWRWVGEMDEIADTFAAAGLPDGFHRAASEVFARLGEFKNSRSASVEQMLEALLNSSAAAEDAG